MDFFLFLAYFLIVLGLGLMLAEAFVPTGGILFALASILILMGIYLSFVYGDTATGWTAVIAVIVMIPLTIWSMAYVWPRLFGYEQLEAAAAAATIATMPGIAELESLRGKLGKAVSALRPSGIADFEGKRVDVITEGVLVEPGEWVRVIEVKPGRVVVRPVPPPNPSRLDNVTY